MFYNNQIYTYLIEVFLIYILINNKNLKKSKIFNLIDRIYVSKHEFLNKLSFL